MDEPRYRSSGMRGAGTSVEPSQPSRPRVAPESTATAAESTAKAETEPKPEANATPRLGDVPW